MRSNPTAGLLASLFSTGPRLSLTRGRRLICAAGLALGVLATPLTAVAAEPDMRVVLLGTGSPVPLMDRWGPSTLVEAGSHRFLFDAGRGVPVRLWQIGIPTGALDAVFLTHFHSDHTVGLPDLWLTGALGGGFGERKAPFHVIGPVGTQDLIDGLKKAYASDIKARLDEGKANGNVKPVIGFETKVDEFAAAGVVYDQDGVKVTAFDVNHGDEIKPAVGYRIDYKGRSVLISGDTRKNDNVIKYGRGVDVLVHEVASAKPDLMRVPIIKLIVHHHTTPAEAGEVFTATRPKMAVYTHLVLLSSKTIPAPSVEDVVQETRTTYAGPLTVGEDLTTIDVGDTVTVHRVHPAAKW